jgi:hypothetical protein
MRESVDEFVPEVGKLAVVEHERRNESVVMVVVAVAVEVEVGHKDVPGDTDPWGLMQSWDGVPCCPYRAYTKLYLLNWHTHTHTHFDLPQPSIATHHDDNLPPKNLVAQKLYSRIDAAWKICRAPRTSQMSVLKRPETSD